MLVGLYDSFFHKHCFLIDDNTVFWKLNLRRKVIQKSKLYIYNGRFSSAACVACLVHRWVNYGPSRGFVWPAKPQAYFLFTFNHGDLSIVVAL